MFEEMSSSVRILHYYFSALPGFSARDSDISTFQKLRTVGCFNFFFTRPAFACGFYVRFLFQIPNLINIGHLQTCHGGLKHCSLLAMFLFSEFIAFDDHTEVSTEFG